MSRIGLAPIEIPSGVTVDVKDNVVIVKGPKGELTQEISSLLEVSIEDGTLELKRNGDSKQERSFHGLYRALINNMIVGVNEGYKTEQELVGVGYRASVKGQQLELALGFSHPIILELPQEIKVNAVMEKGKAPLITLESADKQLIGMVAAKIRSFRKPEPYKGKGIKFKGEYIRRKAGKAASK